MIKIIKENLDKDNLLVEESLFHTGNGYVGMRGNFEEGYPNSMDSIRGTYINAFYDKHELHYEEKFPGFPTEAQKILNLVDTQTIEIYINGEKFSCFDGELKSYKRILDTENGYTKREIEWKSNIGDEASITFKRLTSFSILELILLSVSVKAKTDLNIKIVSKQKGDCLNYFNPNDPRVAAFAEKNLIAEKVYQQDNKSIITLATTKSGLKMASCVKHHINVDNNPVITTSSGEINENIVSYEFTLKSGETVELDKYCIFTDTLRHKANNKDYELTAIELMDNVFGKKQEIYEKQREYLDKYWKTSKVEIDGDDSIKEGVYFNLYQLLQSVGKDMYSNICAKGLSGEGYEGHYFWDTEIYMLPYFTLTNREIAKNLLNYRYTILEYAKQHAKLMGHSKGALYPWRTITGTECSAYFPSGSAQYHIIGDIAYSFIQYYLVTNEIEFFEEKGSEVLFEMARIWLEVGHFDSDGKFKIDCVTGPDEYTCIVNNNYYTNSLAKYHLYWAVKFYNILKERNKIENLCNKISLSYDEVCDWEKASVNMYLPYDDNLKINKQDDSFLNKKVWDFQNKPKDKTPLLMHYHPLEIYRHQVLKQADTVLSHFLLEDYAEPDTIKNSFEYYEKLTTHDSSLSCCIHSIMAAKLKNQEKAYDYFIKTARLDLDNEHKNTKDGIHTANMGGTYMSIVFGFAGLRIKEEGLFLNPHLPKQWKGYSFCLNYKNSLIYVSVSDKVRIKLLEGSSVNIHVYSKEYEINDNTETNIILEC